MHKLLEEKSKGTDIAAICAWGDNTLRVLRPLVTVAARGTKRSKKREGGTGNRTNAYYGCSGKYASWEGGE